MDLYFWFIQLIGLVAWLFLVTSYYRKDTNRILVFQIIATFLYCVHYYLLGAYSGLYICVFEVVRDYLYYKTDADEKIYFGTTPLYIFFAYISYTVIFDLLPIASSLIDGYSLTKKRDRVVFWAVVSYTSWVIYDLCVMSYSCAITDSIVAISNISILVREKKHKKKKKIIRRKRKK